MPIAVTTEQVVALSPDAASAKAARSLATAGPWSGLGENGRSIWGECQGSGKSPYRTQADWAGPAFHCSCPSRKFPCKHGLAMLLLLAEKPGLFSAGAAPEWVTAWIAGREQRAGARAAAKDGGKETGAAPADPEAKAKRAAQRESRVMAGVEGLEMWLGDLVAQGLASAPNREFSYWDGQAARLVDAQAPGLARAVRELGAAVSSGAGWQDRAVDAIGRLVLLLAAYRRMDSLDEATQADVRAAVGFTMAQSEVLASPAVSDGWVVIGRRVEEGDERVRMQRTWLAGTRTGRMGMLLDFAAGGADFAASPRPGMAIEGDLHFFPGAAPLRVVAGGVREPARLVKTLPGAASVEAAMAVCGERWAANPWTGPQAMVLGGVRPQQGGRGWQIADETGALGCHEDWRLLAVSGGRPVTVAGEWNGQMFRALAVEAEGRLVDLSGAAGARG